MGVGRADGDAFRCDASFFFQTIHHFVANIRWHAAIIYRDEYCEAFPVAADGERPGPNPLRDAIRFGFAGGITSEPDGVVGGDVNFGDANWPEIVLPGARDDERDQRNSGE